MSKIKIPNYTLGEELTNSISHGVGAIFAVVALILCLIKACINGSTLDIVCASIYGISMIIMYIISCLYHALGRNLGAKKVFRILDHCDIYVFIAGCYTPYCLSLIGGVTGWILFGVVWLCAVIGILLNSISLEKTKKLSLILYLVMGWMIVFSFKPLVMNIDKIGLYLLLIGGIVYSIGAILYGIGKKKRYVHSVFHFFVLAATVLQFFSIYIYVF